MATENKTEQPVLAFSSQSEWRKWLEQNHALSNGIWLQFDTSNIHWERVAEILQTVGMAYHDSAIHKTAFENSYVVVFVFDEDEMIGFGRAISDGAYQAAVYDVAVLPDYQGKGIGKAIVDRIIAKCPNCNVILYAAPGKDLFYEKFNFRKMKTGMALFTDIEKMKQKGFTE